MRCRRVAVVRGGGIAQLANHLMQAAKRLKDTVKWRLAEQPHTKVCTKCMAKPRAHYMHVVSHPNDCVILSNLNTAHPAR